MSYTNINNNVKIVDKNLVEKILEQGQKLRNAMVGSILKQDPFNTEIIYNKHFNTPRNTKNELNDFKKVDPLTTLDEKRLEAFIKGEYMTKEEEKLALDTLRSLSAPDLCKTTEKSLNSARDSSCKCYTCEIYNSNNLYCDLRRKNIKENPDYKNSYPDNEITRDIQEKYRNENTNFLKYVDSLKVSINSLILNETGNQKVSSPIKNKVPYDLNQSYFLEYHVPDSLVNKDIVSKSKVNSGLENNYVRLCSRRNNDSINFKQVTIHDVRNLDKLNLDKLEIKFKISQRTAKQKHAGILGFAKFNLGSFLLSKYLTCGRGLSIFLNENTPIVVGTLKVSLQLGCGRLYFGQEFIDAVSTTKRNSVILDSDDSANQLNKEKPVLKSNDTAKVTLYHSKSDKPRKSDLLQLKPNEVANSHSNIQEHIDYFSKSIKNDLPQKSTKRTSYFENKEPKNNSLESNTLNQQIIQKDHVGNKILKQQISETEKQILFGFLYISEAQYLSKPINTYITCQPFCQCETSCSKLVTDSSNPVFNFCQLIPLVFEDDLLHLLRENYMVLEFWQKTDTTESVIGLTKIALHQFYLAYRNSIILKYLSKNQLPVIGTDWWEPIYTVDKEEVLGQVQVLVALGTEEQINNLKSERGFANHIVKAKFSHPKSPQSKYVNKDNERLNLPGRYSVNNYKQYTRLVDNSEIKDKSEIRHNFANKSIFSKQGKLQTVFDIRERSKFIDQAVNTSIFPRSEILTTVQKLDVGTQSDVEMDKKMEEKEKVNSTQEMLGTFLNQLMSQRQRNVFVENSTNTEMVQPDTNKSSQSLQDAQTNTNIELRKTTDLLDSLQKALSLDGIQNVASTVKKFVWRKATNAVMSPNTQTDVVLGFAAVDLTVLLAGFPNVQGWFNIVDFSGKCNGQINIHIIPLENLSRYELQKEECNCNTPPSNNTKKKIPQPEPEPENEPSEIDYVYACQKVTNEDSDTSSDGAVEEFEKDINSLCIEEDFDLINFEEEARKLNSNHSKDNVESSASSDVNFQTLLAINDKENELMHIEGEKKTNNSDTTDSTEGSSNSLLSVDTNQVKEKEIITLDKHLKEGKQRIDTLLEKLSLLSADTNNPFTSRYVSGCSLSNDSNMLNIDTEAILKELDHTSRPNIQSTSGFNALTFQQLYGGSVYSNSQKNSSNTSQPSNSDTSLITNFSDCRPAPDGQGNASDEKIIKK
ncbi:hypothetical protein NQ314_011796 [Rhamnusium bicolor]|uniref:C2 domain-containing protein 3 n=1 Tax=Rhamnusium bicolor TaxID=1586634 RepID=A0AAV8XF41_9CUCU|nr:hypothetical protein NQ314_011796 [Rhamnusium bicolor]